MLVVINVLSSSADFIDRTYDHFMRKFTICASAATLLLVGLHPPVSAQLSEKEEQVYTYALHLGWAGAECNAYEQGMIPKSWVLETFTNIGTDKTLGDTYKHVIFQVIQESQQYPKCQVLFKEWAGSSD